jgi:transposase
MAKNQRIVIAGVDTHADTHSAVVVDEVGRVIGTRDFGSDAAGCRALLAWLRRHGQVQAVGVEGTGSYGAGLSRLLTAREVKVIEVDRPDRKARRSRGKSDPVDAEAAARAVLAQTATGTPKTRDGAVEAIRALRVARTGAVKARTAALNSLLALARTAVEPLAQELHGRTARQLVPLAATAPAAAELADPAAATRQALHRIAVRIQHLDVEIRQADGDLRRLTRQAAPALLAAAGVGPEVAAQLLITAGDNPQRLTDESSFARLTGVAPLPASSGRTTRHRLSRAGDRQANRALHTVTLSRMSHDPRTRDYVARRTSQGLSKPEIMRCLKRYIARELFPLIINPAIPIIDHAPTRPAT